MKFIAKTLFGLEQILADEIVDLGGEDVTVLNRAVSFHGDLKCMYRVNYWSRLSLRVVMPIMSFTAHNETVFYKRVRRYNWHELFGPEDTFCIDSTVKSSYFKHSKYVALKTKDAIVDLFRMKYSGLRPSVDVKDPTFRINVHCSEKDFTISIDSSGDSLHKRGYRQSKRQAPLNEVLAAGMIVISGWDKVSPLYDPMCGSGTILTEAYTYAHKIPPRLSRDKYAFMNWADYDSKLWEQITEEYYSDKRIPDFPQMFGSDIDHIQVRETDSLLEKLKYSKIRLSQKNFITSLPPKSKGWIITNPPYGERLKSISIEGLYEKIGNTLKDKYSGWQAWIISSNKSAIKSIGLRSSQKNTLFNGALECKFLKYDMYDGSKKLKD